VQRSSTLPISPHAWWRLRTGGPAGGRDVRNRSGETARVLLLWTTGFPAAVCYPETGEWVLRTDRGADEIRLRPG
jgi:hypothetical protein